ncbi:XrtA system polysaccharide chain length determinant [Megalodesulfovibrio paquesii]
MDIKEILKRLLVLARTHKVFLACCICLFTTIAIGFAYMKPEKFQVSTTVYLEQSVVTDLVKGIAVTPSVDSKAKMLGVSMTSRTMLSKVLSELNKDVGMNELQKDAYLKDLVTRLRLDSREKDSVYTISFFDGDPIFARDFTNALVRKYIEENITNKRDDSLEATRFLAEQIEYFKKRIDQAEAKINTFKSEQGMTLAVDETFLRGEISNSEKKLEDLTIRRRELESKKRLFGLEGEPTETTSPLVAQLQAQLAALRQKYTDQHPKVAKARAELNAARHQAAGLPVDTGSGHMTPELLQIEIDAYKELEARQEESIERNKKLLSEIPNTRATLAELERTKENELIIYNQLVSRYGQSEVSKQMELQDKSVTFRVLDPAVTPFAPMPPSKRHIALLGPVAGLVMGLGLLFLFDMLRNKLKSSEQIKAMGLPVLAVIPAVVDEQQERRRARRGRIVFAVAALYVVLSLTGYYILEHSLPMKQLLLLIKAS